MCPESERQVAASEGQAAEQHRWLTGGLQHNLKSENVPPANLSDSPKTAEARVALREYLQPPAVPDHVAAEDRSGVSGLQSNTRARLTSGLSLQLPHPAVWAAVGVSSRVSPRTLTLENTCLPLCVKIT